jgi:hypothetical protein
MFFLEGLKVRFAENAAGESGAPNDEFLDIYAKIKRGARVVTRRSSNLDGV